MKETVKLTCGEALILTPISIGYAEQFYQEMEVLQSADATVGERMGCLPNLIADMASDYQPEITAECLRKKIKMLDFQPLLEAVAKLNTVQSNAAASEKKSKVAGGGRTPT